jgi:hypothetical protein
MVDVNSQRRDRVLSSHSAERGLRVEQGSHRTWFRLALVFLGLFGAAFAVTGLLVALPKPAIGGTCGPGKSSEAAIVALFNPGSIGAGAEPPATSATQRADWMAFVGECQASADGRVLGALVIFVVSLVVAVVGTALLLGYRKRRASAPPPSASS